MSRTRQARCRHVKGSLDRRGLWLVVVLFLAGCGSPLQPSPDGTATLRAIRYVRTRPVTSEATLVTLSYSIPIFGDPYGRSRMSVVVLTPVDNVTFVYDRPASFDYVPFDTECTFWVSDAAVSPFFVARNIYVNDTPIRIEVAGSEEYGRFKVGRNGRVY